MPNPATPEPPTVLFETKPTATGYKLRGTAFQGQMSAISVALSRRTLLTRDPTKSEYQQGWFIVSELVVYTPMALTELRALAELLRPGSEGRAGAAGGEARRADGASPRAERPAGHGPELAEKPRQSRPVSCPALWGPS
jgi:hypothetical protein